METRLIDHSAELRGSNQQMPMNQPAIQQTRRSRAVTAQDGQAGRLKRAALWLRRTAARQRNNVRVGS